MSKKRDIEVTTDIAAYRVHMIQRELAYHMSIATAAWKGLEDCIDIHIGDEEPLDDDACGHLASWSHRLYQAMEAVNQVSGDAAGLTKTLRDLTMPKPASAVEN